MTKNHPAQLTGHNLEIVMAVSSIATRRKRAVESFKTAADCIGTLEPGAALFAILRKMKNIRSDRVMALLLKEVDQ